MNKKFLICILASLAVCASLGSRMAKADSTLHVGTGSGSACAMGCAGDPTRLGSATTVSIFQNSGGPPTLAQPVLVIVGVPNDVTNLFTTDPLTGITAVNAYPGGTTTTGTSSFATGGTYSLKNPVVDGFFGDMGSKQEVYSFLKLTGANNSNSFTNWAGADSSLSGIKATDFGIYVFAVNATLAPKGLINFDLSSSLPTGSIIVAYGQGRSHSGDKTIVFDTPFTEAGYKDGRSSSPTPEPGSLMLLGSGLLALGGGLRRRLKQ